MTLATLALLTQVLHGQREFRVALAGAGNMSRVVHAHKDGMDIITGPGPQAARNLGLATLEAMEQRWR